MKKQKYLHKYLHKYNLCLIVSTVLLLPTSQVKSTNELHYALFTSGPYEVGFDSLGVIPAIELAEEEIFKYPFTLEGLRLTHIPVQDTMVGTYWLEKSAIALQSPKGLVILLLELKKSCADLK